MKTLPLGVQDFGSLIAQNCLYVDKTRQIAAMVDEGKYFFLSRPRRFGKSLLVSTLKAFLEGRRDLFRGLWIEQRQDWTPHPVIHLDASLIPHDTEIRLKAGLLEFCQQIAEQYGVEVRSQEYDAAFAELIRRLSQQTGNNVVVLIDEYDKPILDALPDLTAARRQRDILKNFYEILKGSDHYLRFVFITGVSKFSKVSVFSGLNNLRDITLSPRFATLTGYTQEELERDFDEHLQQVCLQHDLTRTALLAEIQRWYNGYSWNGEDRVYNPFSVLNFFAEQQFSNYWFASGTPTFLLDLITSQQYETTEFENKRVPELIFNGDDLEQMNVFALLFQTGYLTITAKERDYAGATYTLNYPNFEVKQAFLTLLLHRFTTYRLEDVPQLARSLRYDLEHGDVENFIRSMRGLFAKIPYTLHLPQEAYYHSLFYMILALMGVDINLEVLTDQGRIDGVLECQRAIYVIEFKYGHAGSKMETLTAQAIRQIETTHYADRFLNDPRPCVLVGVGFIEKEIGYQTVCRKI
ncbi:hypothetical protein U14_01255 [Candidatus Moduliflexus flocculans]|uniref:AAA-ATPase-like domain-containing protein n=1 Tax=Candidatus Moduliflexus flocculans TaxID=1499966 RepID=A0A0S6VYK6_9BACT|nr:hypothetical protein U14_01255 [Candidatus Moduliflexus flocculans]